jgi:hypothetical protein
MFTSKDMAAFTCGREHGKKKAAQVKEVQQMFKNFVSSFYCAH